MARIPERLGCSTISFQHLTLPRALDTITSLGFSEIDLGALPGVCDHVPFELDETAAASVAELIASSGLRVRSVNGDIGDLNVPDSETGPSLIHLDRLLRLAAAVGAEALVLPCGALARGPIRALGDDLQLIASRLAYAAEAARAYGVSIWVESLHFLRLCWNRERADSLHARLADTDVRPVMDVAHVTAAGDHIIDTISAWGNDIAHVHLRDAVAGDFSLPIGSGGIDFDAVMKALAVTGFTGTFSLELPSRTYVDNATQKQSDEEQAAREAAMRDAAERIAPLISSFSRN